MSAFRALKSPMVHQTLEMRCDMRTETKAAEATELEAPEEEILCALYATLDGIGGKLRRINVRLTTSSGRDFCRLRASFVRDDKLVVEARAATGRDAIRAASQGLKDALAERLGALQLTECGPRRPSLISGPRRVSVSLGPADAWRAKRESRGTLEKCRLLLALKQSEPPAAGLDWAAVLARQLSVELHVLRVLPGPAYSGPMRGDWLDITRDVQRMLEATRETRAWCDDVLPDAVRAEHVCVRVGDFGEEVATRAQEIEPDMIMISDGANPAGDMATVLARTAARPVLVAREQSSRCTLLAATDLQDEGYPVLRQAAELGHYLHASVLAFHQVDVAQTGCGAAIDARRGVWTAMQKERLEMVADRLLYDGEVFVAEGEDPAVAIVAHARHLEADTIVVGTRPRGTEGSARRNTAARVVERTDRSVIIVPIEDPS